MKTIKPKQLEFLDWEMGVFFHFGIRTYYEGHKDWDMQEMPLDAFDPKQLDCEQWVRTVKEAGAAYGVLICKHHDGFANWPSKYTDYSVANTPWKDGKGDVVREFVDACRKYDLKIGLYYSPAEFGSRQKSAEEYDQYFINQISELLGDYGKIDYLWFDACGSENHKYDTDRIVKEIRRLQPEILMFNLWDPDTRWVGNESGLAARDNRNTVRLLDVSVQTETREFLQEDTFLPAECDCRIRSQNWFYSEKDTHTLKSVEELMGLYYYSVGRGANLLLNIAPDRNGLLPQEDAARFREFGEAIRAIFANPAASLENAQRKENTYSLKLDVPQLMDHLVIEEVLNQGECIEQFSVWIHPYDYGCPICVYEGRTVGHKHICKFPPVMTQQLDVMIEKEAAPHTLKGLTAYKAKR